MEIRTRIEKWDWLRLKSSAHKSNLLPTLREDADGKYFWLFIG
jgi:hypothetical protein